jgi:hypothetical protein
MSTKQRWDKGSRALSRGSGTRQPDTLNEYTIQVKQIYSAGHYNALRKITQPPKKARQKILTDK